jgi:hypothetical protein
VLADTAPGLQSALLAARAAGHSHVYLDGTLVRTDRSRAIGPHHPSRPVVVGKTPPPRREHPGRHRPGRMAAGVSDVRAGREHDTTCVRAHHGLLAATDEWTDEAHGVLADLGYEGENTRLTCPIKNTRGQELSVDQRTINALHAATRALAERGNSLLKTTFKALRQVSLCPWRIGAITAAALVLLHHEHDRST